MLVSVRSVFFVFCLGCASVSHAEPTAYPHARPTDNPTALDRYVAKPDDSFTWKRVKVEEEDGLTSYSIDMTSQKWRNDKEVDRPLWKHWVTVIIPDEVKHDTALMYIGGGNNKTRNPRTADNRMKRIARETGTVAAQIYMVPNQPLVFADAFGWGRSEDAMIAYTWDKFLRTGDEEWPARLPMTKAVVRALDTVQAFCASEEAGNVDVNDFVVAGGSKRGWTTWTTAIVDTRVKAIIPCVIDVLNVIPSFRHHRAVYGHWSAAVGDYQALRVLDWLDTPENDALMAIEDPFRYKDRLTMPKLIVNAANDQFFVPDSSQFYFAELPDQKWLRYVPNTGHSLGGSDAEATVTAFYHAIAADLPIPNYDFEFENDGSIVVTVEPASNGEVIEPTSARLWQAHNPKKRDVRGSTAAYTPIKLTSENGVYRATVEKPETGYTLYFVELTFPGPSENTPFKFTSGVRSIPEATPFQHVPVANPPKGFLSKN